MVMQTGIGLTRGDTIAYAAVVIDVIVQLDRSGRQARHQRDRAQRRAAVSDSLAAL